MAKEDTKPSAATYIDPYRAYNFKLEIEGVTQGHFTEVSGMEASIAPISYREAGNNQVVHYVPGRTEYGAVTLRYGVTKSTDLWDWFKTGIQGKIARRNVSIVLLDSDGSTEVTRWNLYNAWATQWRGSMLDTRSQEVAIESVTLVCETLERA
jgi:phage tail-like protein